MKNFSWTIIAGVFVFVFSQYFLKLILEPKIELRKIIMKISHTLLFYRAYVLIGDTNDKQLHEEISKLSANLLSAVHLIPFYPFFKFLSIFSLPEKKNILLACRELNVLSYGVLDMGEPKEDVAKRNQKALKNISEYLGIRTSYELDDN